MSTVGDALQKALDNKKNDILTLFGKVRREKKAKSLFRNLKE